MNEQFYKHLMDSLHDGVYFVDRDSKITYWNKGAERISGYTAEEVLGKSCAANLLVHVDTQGKQLCLGGCPLAQTIMDAQPREAEVFLHHKNGHRVPVSVRISPMLDHSGGVIGAVEIFSDGTSKRELLDELSKWQQQSLRDQLTGVGNRRAAALEFEARIKAMKTYNMPFGLLFLDIDGFKAVNDTHGHEVGDRVLVMVATTLGNALRGGDALFRWGGEEFLAFVRMVDKPTFTSIAERLRLLVCGSFLTLPEGPLRVTVSIGGSLAQQTDTIDSLVKRADAQMYLAKNAGRDCASLDCG